MNSIASLQRMRWLEIGKVNRSGSKLSQQSCIGGIDDLLFPLLSDRAHMLPLATCFNISSPSFHKVRALFFQDN